MIDGPDQSKREELTPSIESATALSADKLTERAVDTNCPTANPEITVEFFRPSDVTVTLANGLSPDSSEYQELEQRLEAMPGFLRVSKDDLLTYSQGFEHVVNCTGYSGQGIHHGQRELLREAFAAILKDQGWDSDETLLISGGTAVGVPDEFISTLTEREQYQAAAIMALPGVEYSITPGYSFVCTEEAWSNWGDEVETMAEVATETVVAGGGVQAFTDALHAARDKEPVAVVVNTYNALARVEYELNGVRSDIILKPSEPEIERGTIVPLNFLQQQVEEVLVAEGMAPEEAAEARVTSLPISGLVTEVRRGERRSCSQDLLYFAITGEAGLLPDEFCSDDLETVEALRQDLVEHLDLYYLFDDPYEGVHSSAVIKLDEAVQVGNAPLLDKIIDHAVEHDVHDPAAGTFGPAALGARTADQLAELLKASLSQRMGLRAA